MSEITTNDETPHAPGCPPALARLPITDISQWAECYCLMAAVISMRYPHKAAELFAYQATILRAERNYEAGHWVMYDRQFRREALARRDLNWSRTDPCLYNEAFTGLSLGAFCLQDDHTSQYCPKNPNRSWIGWFPDPSNWHAQPGNLTARPQAAPPQQEICRRAVS